MLQTDYTHLMLIRLWKEKFWGRKSIELEGGGDVPL